MSKPPIYFLRHGQTDWNVEGRLQGQLDVPLNPIGRAQAKRNGGVLAELLFEPAAFDFVSSPLTRTRQTMQIARAELGLDDDGFNSDERLLEINFGQWEGKTWSEVRAADPERLSQRDADAFNNPMPGGESYAMVMARVVSWLDSVIRPTVVVSHGGVMRCLRGHMQGLSDQAILALEVPQDRVMLIADGALQLI